MQIEKTGDKIDALNNFALRISLFYSPASGGAHGNEEG
jgi:hypothetical protein